MKCAIAVCNVSRVTKRERRAFKCRRELRRVAFAVTSGRPYIDYSVQLPPCLPPTPSLLSRFPHSSLTVSNTPSQRTMTHLSRGRWEESHHVDRRQRRPRAVGPTSTSSEQFFPSRRRGRTHVPRSQRSLHCCAQERDSAASS